MGFERERGQENGSFPVVEALKPQGFKEKRNDDVKIPHSPPVENEVICSNITQALERVILLSLTKAVHSIILERWFFNR